MGRNITTLSRASLVVAALLLNSSLPYKAHADSGSGFIPKGDRILMKVEKNSESGGSGGGAGGKSGGGETSEGGSSSSSMLMNPLGLSVFEQPVDATRLRPTNMDGGGMSSGCYQPFMQGVGYSDESKIDDFLRLPPDPTRIGAALDVTVLANNCPVATGFTRYSNSGYPTARALRWEWSPTLTVSTIRLSPSLSDYLPNDPSNNFPNNSPAPLMDFLAYIDFPWHISTDGNMVVGSAQFTHSAYSGESQQKQGFLWTKTAAGAQTFNLLPDLSPNTPIGGDDRCMLSSVAYDATEIAQSMKIVGQGTSDPQGRFDDDTKLCDGIKGKAATTGAIPTFGISQTYPTYSYTAATSVDGLRSVINELDAGGHSKRAFMFDTSTTSLVQLKYLPNTLQEPSRFAQAEAITMTPGNPSSALIFGHSNMGGNTSWLPDTASSAVIWDSTGNIVNTVGPSFPSMAQCDWINGECPSTEARDGSAYRTVVGVAYLPRQLHLGHPCALNEIAPEGQPREAFIYTPPNGTTGGIQKLRDFAMARFPTTTAAGVAARNELNSWVGLCEAEAIYESANTLTVVGVGVRENASAPNGRSTQGFIIHIPKISGIKYATASIVRKATPTPFP